MPDDTTTQDAPISDSSNPTNQDDSDGGEQKRRRRRRRKKSTAAEGGGTEGSVESAEAEEIDAASDSDSQSDQAEERPKRKRSRRSRGKRSDEETSESTEPEERSGPAPKRKRELPPVAKDSEVFADIAFADLGLRNSVMKGVEEAGFEKATAIQAAMIPVVLAGKDVLGQAKTGSGKTAAFGLPLFHMASRNLPFQSVVLCPTRELAIQISKELNALGQFTPIRAIPIYGGQAMQKQFDALAEGPEIIVATPGRLMDVLQRGKLHFENVKFVVLDEVDRMLDIGFRDDIRKILSGVHSDHQTIFVSATISGEIEQLGRRFMRENEIEKIETSAGSLTVSLVEQHHLTVEPWDKRGLLAHLLKHEDPALTIVFCRTKRTVDLLTKKLREKKIDAHAIHGDMYQAKRNAVMNKLRAGDLGVLIASDLAARGLDVDGISHVINYDLPDDPEVYIHRIGRTARAGRHGVAWSFVCPDEGPLLTQIEMLANCEIPKMAYPDFKPGSVPERVQADRSAAEKRRSEPAQMTRFASPAPAADDGEVKIAADTNRFPGGLVPKKLPPKTIYGKVRTARSGRNAPPPPAGDADAEKAS